MVIHLSLDIPVRASAERVFAALVDWDSQGDWMLGTTVRVPAGASGTGVGGRIEAFTGVWRIGFLDTMTITQWDEPYRVDVVHTGRVVRGTGTFAVRAVSENESVFTWAEDLELPLGALGRAGWVIVRPLFVSGVRRSLTKFARLVEAGSIGAPVR